MSASPPLTLTLASDSPEVTLALGKRMGQLLRPGLVIALRGDLGAGKTTLTQGIGKGLGIEETMTSPTFTFVNEYRFTPKTAGAEDSKPELRRGEPSRWRLLHIDLYRLPESTELAEAEAATFGLDESFDEAAADHTDTLVIVEWAERIAPLLPDDHLAVDLAHTEDGVAQRRSVTLTAHGATGRRLLEALQLHV